jgi:hypothetical protein
MYSMDSLQKCATVYFRCGRGDHLSSAYRPGSQCTRTRAILDYKKTPQLHILSHTLDIFIITHLGVSQNWAQNNPLHPEVFLLTPAGPKTLHG